MFHMCLNQVSATPHPPPLQGGGRRGGTEGPLTFLPPVRGEVGRGVDRGRGAALPSLK